MKTEGDFLRLAMSKYDNPKLSFLDEFESDIKRFLYLNMLLNRYRLDKTDIKDRLIINHIVIICNCFTVAAAIQMLRFKISKENYQILDTFLLYLGLIEIEQEFIDQSLFKLLNE